MNLPIIIGFGGISSAGRSSDNHAFNRLIFNQLKEEEKKRTIQSLSTLMGIKDDEQILKGTLVRKLNEQWYKEFASNSNTIASINPPIQITVRTKNLPKKIPENWEIQETSRQETSILIHESSKALLPSPLIMETNAAAQLPDYFNPGSLYNSNNHPRSIQMSLFALSDCISNSGLEWEEIRALVPPDKISIYSGSSFPQLDKHGLSGMIKSSIDGTRPTTKQIPLGYSQSPADFANAYVLGNLGSSGSSLGACASFLYNLKQACTDIQTGKSHIAIAGASEAPLVPELMNAFQIMGALSNDKDILNLDNLAAGSAINYKNACRPFGNNAGFVMSESSQYFLLASPKFAAEIGARNFGAVSNVFSNADGYKKSISSTGVGNFVTLAKATADIKSMLGEETLRNHSFVHAHGTGTPLNRITESHILNEIAKAFSIENWPITAIKGQMGHSQGASAADQMAMTLGTWNTGYIPGIKTTKELADDVEKTNLNILLETAEFSAKAALFNAKGFGGNNATGVLLSPDVSEKAIKKSISSNSYNRWKSKQEKVTAKAMDNNQKYKDKTPETSYSFNNNVLNEKNITLNQNEVFIPGYPPVNIKSKNEYGDIF